MHVKSNLLLNFSIEEKKRRKKRVLASLLIA